MYPQLSHFQNLRCRESLAEAYEPIRKCSQHIAVVILELPRPVPNQRIVSGISRLKGRDVWATLEERCYKRAHPAHEGLACLARRSFSRIRSAS